MVYGAIGALGVKNEYVDSRLRNHELSLATISPHWHSESVAIQKAENKSDASLKPVKRRFTQF